MVVYSNGEFSGLGRAPLADPDDFQSYSPGLFWESNFYANSNWVPDLLAPMDSRATASPTGTRDYVFYRIGGMSWSIPYVAAIYALAAQVDPAITADGFWSLAKETARTIELEHQGRMYSFGPILDPVALIAALGE